MERVSPLPKPRLVPLDEGPNFNALTKVLDRSGEFLAMGNFGTVRWLCVNVQSVERMILSISNRFNLEWCQHTLRQLIHAASPHLSPGKICRTFPRRGIVPRLFFRPRQDSGIDDVCHGDRTGSRITLSELVVRIWSAFGGHFQDLLGSLKCNSSVESIMWRCSSVGRAADS